MVGGEVDDYHGNLFMILFKHSVRPFNTYRGDRVAQLICLKFFYPDLKEVKELDDSENGKKGCGSTGRY